MVEDIQQIQLVFESEVKADVQINKVQSTAIVPNFAASRATVTGPKAGDGSNLITQHQQKQAFD